MENIFYQFFESLSLSVYSHVLQRLVLYAEILLFVQVIDWLNNHGDVFLKKNTSIGKTLQRAKALQKSHEHFESVARVSTENS